MLIPGVEVDKPSTGKVGTMIRKVVHVLKEREAIAVTRVRDDVM